MIVRVFQVSTHPGKEAGFRRFFTETALPMMRRTPGLVSVTAGTPRPDSPTDFCMVMIWQDLDVLKAFVGADYQNPHIVPEEVELVRSRTIGHYELVEA